MRRGYREATVIGTGSLDPHVNPGMDNQTHRIDIIGVAADATTAQQRQRHSRELLQDDRSHHVALLSFWGLIRARNRAEYRLFLSQASQILTTSRLVAWGARALGRKIPEVERPFDVAIRYLSLAEQLKQSVYLVGGDKRVLLQAERNLRDSFPRLQIVGRFAGHYPPALQDDILEAISKATPALLLVGPDVPGNELWLMRHKRQLPACVGLWVGDCFDIFAGRRPSKPTRMERFSRGMKSLLTHPWRFGRIVALLYYVIVLLVYRIRGL